MKVMHNAQLLRAENKGESIFLLYLSFLCNINITNTVIHTGKKLMIIL